MVAGMEIFGTNHRANDSNGRLGLRRQRLGQPVQHCRKVRTNNLRAATTPPQPVNGWSRITSVEAIQLPYGGIGEPSLRERLAAISTKRVLVCASGVTCCRSVFSTVARAASGRA